MHLLEAHAVQSREWSTEQRCVRREQGHELQNHCARPVDSQESEMRHNFKYGQESFHILHCRI